MSPRLTQRSLILNSIFLSLCDSQSLSLHSGWEVDFFFHFTLKLSSLCEVLKYIYITGSKGSLGQNHSLPLKHTYIVS